MATKELKKRTYNAHEAARVAGVGYTAIYKGIHAGTIPHIKMGWKIVIPKVAFHRWLDSCAGKSGSQNVA